MFQKAYSRRNRNVLNYFRNNCGKHGTIPKKNMHPCEIAAGPLSLRGFLDPKYSCKDTVTTRFCLMGFVAWIRKTQQGCGGLAGENPGAIPKAGPIFQQPLSLQENAQTLAGIAFRAVGKSGKNFPAAPQFAGKPFQQRISDSHSLFEFSEWKHLFDSTLRRLFCTQSTVEMVRFKGVPSHSSHCSKAFYSTPGPLQCSKSL